MRRWRTSYLLTGGNLGDRFDNLARARALIERYVGPVLAASALYETEAWGVEDQPPYLNQALQVRTKLGPFQLLDRLQRIEGELGRTRPNKWASRTMDIDILFYENLVMKTRRLEIPHPRLHRRNFALAPLKEIAPELFHPLLCKTIEELLAESQDPLEVARLSPRPLLLP
ncbi:MAG: 2-amino-4-hydroxy-6-hydroxymethyldihydropteridine diphosphokinase [Bacteroidetes bacterium]|nr:MAG: 2-amino-4-hydroxy-6-hydroxymethyldihydropteridine diphosphokinase [Bacteroidota bacterium]